MAQPVYQQHRKKKQRLEMCYVPMGVKVLSKEVLNVPLLLLPYGGGTEGIE